MRYVCRGPRSTHWTEYFIAGFKKKRNSACRFVKPGRAASFALKFWFPLITFSLVNRFTSLSHELLLIGIRPFHQHVALWPSDDLDIQHCSLTICVKVLFFSYNLFISWQIYTHTMLLWSRPLHWCATLWPLNDLDNKPLKPFFTYKDVAMSFFNMSIFERQSTDADIDNQGFTICPLFPSKPS